MHLLPALLLGLVLGMRHATDADHVVAITTIVTRERELRGAARIGALWGIGHTVTILLVGGMIILFRIVIPPRLGLALEFAVALMLIGLGIHSLFGRGRSEATALSAARPVFVGIVHGLAGSAAVALLVLTTIPDPLSAMLYLLVFGAGTIIGMMAITASIAVPISISVSRFARFNHQLRLAAGVLSVAFGLFLAREIGFVNGLFSANPSWTPH
jgi:hypothetical protein